MSYYRHPHDDIHVGDYVVLEVTYGPCAEEDRYVYQVSGTVRIGDGVKMVGRNGIGEGKIIEHRPRPIPSAFGTHIKYPRDGVEWVKTSGDYWRSDDGKVLKTSDLKPGWVLLRDATR